MSTICIALGVPGAGKSSVIAVAEKRGYSIVTWGTLMFELAGKNHPDRIKTRDDIRGKLLPDEQLALQLQVGRAIAKMQGKTIVDTHCSIETPNGYLPGLPEYIIAELKGKVKRLFYITAAPEDIHRRRKADASRSRPGSMESIREHDEFNKSLLAAYSVQTGAPAKIILNSDGKLQEAQEAFLLALP